MAFDTSKLSPREKNIIGMLLLVLSSLPFFYYTLPAWNNYTDSISKTQQGKSKLEDLDAQIKRLEKYQIKNIELAKKIETQKKYLAKSYEIDFLVQDLKKICDESSITLESFTPSGSEPVNIILEKQLQTENELKRGKRGKLKEAVDKLKGQDLPVDLYRFPIEVKITGDFTDIVELFKKLEKYGRVISVENISIGKVQTKETFDRLSRVKPKQRDTEDGSLFSTFDLVAYSLPREDEVLPFTQLEKSLGSGKSTFKFKTKRR